MKYKGIYRLKCPFSLDTNQYPRKLNGTFEDVDVYISCYNNVQIFYYGQGVLEVYVPSLIRGRNMIKQINEIDSNIIKDILETDSEVLFKFHSKYIKQLENILKPKTNGAPISPFSSKNLPHDKSYKIPDNDLCIYKDIVANVPEKERISVSHMTSKYLKSLANRKHSWESIKSDMAIKGLKGKEYIYAIGKWNEYIKYLSECITERK